MRKGGFVAVPVNYRLLPREILYLLRDFEPKGFGLRSELSDTVKSFKDQASSIRHWDYSRNDISGMESRHSRMHFMHSQDEEPIAGSLLMTIWP